MGYTKDGRQSNCHVSCCIVTVLHLHLLQFGLRSIRLTTMWLLRISTLRDRCQRLTHSLTYIHTYIHSFLDNVHTYNRNTTAFSHSIPAHPPHPPPPPPPHPTQPNTKKQKNKQKKQKTYKKQKKTKKTKTINTKTNINKLSTIK